MRGSGGAAAGATLVLALALAVPAGSGGQGEGLVGYLAKDRIIALAAAADGSIASFTPSPTALASFVALVDPVHVRMFLCASRPGDLVLAARLGRAVETAGNAALSAEFIGVAGDLAEPRSLVADNGVTKAPEIIVYWMDAEVGRMHPEAGAVIEDELAGVIFQARAQIAEEMLLDNDFFRNVFHSDLPLDCKRCHGPAGSGLRGPN
jgi:hypothetical protein